VAADAAAGKLVVAAQTTDNSPVRVLDNITRAASAGAQLAIVDAPEKLLNGTQDRLVRHYREIARHSPLPLGLYDRGPSVANALTNERLAEVLSDPKFVLVKDSSASVVRRDTFLSVRCERPDLLLLNGDEFDCVAYLEAGYDGLLLGGGIFNAPLARQLVDAVQAGEHELAEVLHARMNDLMWRVYGGRRIECWLTGLKQLLVRIGLFSSTYSLLEYPLTETCRAQIDALVSGSDGLGLAEELRARA
jgi:dihydrodipicolinate synthase/N-acetylneuraminate lyase